MNQQGFIREVLGDVVPPKVAEVIYNSFGGTSKGLHFNNLIVGLVLLTRGRDEEKSKYIFSLFASESGSYVVREEMESRLQAVDGEVPPSLRRCFTEGEKVNYEKFKSWLLQNKDAFTFSRWLLSGGVCVTLTDDSDTPTFYQTLAGVTHCTELHTDVSEIVEDILKLHDTTKDNKPIVVEQPCIHGGGKSPLTAAAVEQGEDKAGIIHSYSSSEEKFSDNISTASEASETTGSTTCHADTAVQHLGQYGYDEPENVSSACPQRTNPIGMRGHMAKCYGDLVQELWSGTQKNVAPLKLRWTIAKYAPRFNGFQQQDSQELLAFLLDGLHEDLNRVHDKPYAELKDSDGRPDWEVAAEAWENHLRRNRSIVVDLFHGQLKSQVKCKTCGHISARFDPFNFLSLPLPMDSYMHLEITVIKLDGSTPIRYGLRLNMDEKYTGLKKQLSELCSLKPEQILLAEVYGSNIKNFPQDNQKVRLSVSGFLCAFEIPVPGSPTSVSFPVQTDADRIIFPVIAEESTQPFWNATNSALYCPHQKEGPVRCSVDSGLSPRQPTAPTGGQQPCPGLVVEEHESVELSRRAQAEPISLDNCLRVFTSEEELGEDEMYYCSKCQTHRLATKKLDLWRLPPILIIHLKRFQFVNGRWIKSQKIVKFPCEQFDPGAFLVPRDPGPCQHREVTSQGDDQSETKRCEITTVHTTGTGDGLAAGPQALNAASQSSGKKCNIPSSRSSPCNSPKNQGRGKGRLRLPQLGGKTKLSSSKESLDMRMESGSELEQTASSDLEGSLSEGNAEELLHEEGAGRVLLNGLGHEKQHNDCSDHHPHSTEIEREVGGKGRQCLPQLGGKTKLSSSKESLDMRMESGSELEQTASSDLEGSLSEGNAEELLHEEGAGRVLLNGLGHEKQHNDCSDHHPHSTDHQRDQVALKPLYNLYAISAWENHLRRNRSIVVDLFHGQLKSQVKCKTCGHISARFDPFNFLSLPLPMDSYMHLEITVIKLDGSTPIRYGLRLNMDEKYTGLKKQLSELCSLKPEQILLAEVYGSNIKNFPQDNQKVRLSVSGFLCAFEIPVPGSPTSVSFPVQTESLDMRMESGSELEQTASSDLEGSLSEGNAEELLHEEGAGRVLLNGLGHEKQHNDCSDHHPHSTDHQRDQVALKPLYNLYAISCHSGILGGGHYVTYAKNPNDKWYCFNDSSCKEVRCDEIDTDSAYILFYEQQGVDYAQFLPKTDGKKMADTSSMDEDFESDYKKYCVLQ
ncbi:UNVERIFIED_CONTAM: hypothetical protein FKN15_060741 [Acipenser sinensis]